MKRILFLLAFLLPQQSPPVPATASIEGSISRLGTSGRNSASKGHAEPFSGSPNCSDRYG